MNDSGPVEINRAWWDKQSDEYQRAHGEQLSSDPRSWGVWGVHEDELNILGDVAGLDVLELGCGGAQWSLELARRGGRVVGLDLSWRQLFHASHAARGLDLSARVVHGSAEELPFGSSHFDLVFCDHGAMTFARPRSTVPEAARVLRAGGRLIFNMTSPLNDVCWDAATDSVTTTLHNDYFGMYTVSEAETVSYQMPYGDWIRLFRSCGLVIEDLVEIQPPADARTSYEGYVPLEWARRWPAENIWVLRKED